LPDSFAARKDRTAAHRSGGFLLVVGKSGHHGGIPAAEVFNMFVENAVEKARGSLVSVFP
jgi:hypothetical protein